MKIYQLHRTHSAGESAGYEYFASRREAEKAASDWRRSDDSLLGHASTIEQIEVEPTRRGILRALNRYANHADNG
jgi:hypothetical protein